MNWVVRPITNRLPCGDVLKVGELLGVWNFSGVVWFPIFTMTGAAGCVAKIPVAPAAMARLSAGSSRTNSWTTFEKLSIGKIKLPKCPPDFWWMNFRRQMDQHRDRCLQPRTHQDLSLYLCQWSCQRQIHWHHQSRRTDWPQTFRG
jgi:hypothetical protein